MNMNMNKIFISIVAVALIVGGGAFYSGMKYAQSRNSAAFQNFRNLGGNAAGLRTGQEMGVRNSANFVSGEVISKDDKSITIKLRDGGSKIVFLSDKLGQVKKALFEMSEIIYPLC